MNRTGSGAARMPRVAATVIATSLLLAAAAPPARAQVKQILASGQWSAYGGPATGDRHVCGIQTAGPSGSRLMIEQQTGQTGLDLMLQKGSWSIPANTAIDLSFLFDGRVRFPGHATGAGDVVTVAMTFQQTVPFMRAVRQDTRLQVSFLSGNEPPWSLSLVGSGAVLNAFDECRAALISTTPTQPFTPPAPNAAPAPAPGPAAKPSAPPTQPATPATPQAATPAKPSP
jgi:hypothetical protein